MKRGLVWITKREPQKQTGEASVTAKVLKEQIEVFLHRGRNSFGPMILAASQLALNGHEPILVRAYQHPCPDKHRRVFGIRCLLPNRTN